MNLDTPLEILHGVGKTRAKKLADLGLKTVKDLIFYFPFRYEDYSQLKKIVDLKPNEVVTIQARVDIVANRKSVRTRKYVTEGLVTDETGSIKVIWFNQPFIAKTLKPGDEVFFSGKVDFDKYGVQMVSPGFEKVSLSTLRQAQGDNGVVAQGDDRGLGDRGTIHTARMVPVYHLTAGITEKQLRYFLSQCLSVTRSIEETLPEEVIREYNLIGLSQALENIHFPRSDEFLEYAKKRLQFDELFYIQLKIQQLRKQLDETKSFKLAFLEKPTQDFVNSLPFQLTDDQKKASWEIILDLGKDRPMNRLLEGDVGSGKTVVVAVAIVNVVLNGYKVVMMAPTEILAHQHYETLKKLFSEQGFKIGLFTRSKKEINGEVLTKKNMLDDLKVGKVDIIVGTHALIQADVNLKELGLVIVDEQHRFGVKQRKALIDKEQEILPHFLSMTATPIPRSLSLALYGDLDLSIIKQMPTGRKPIESRLIAENKRPEAYKFIYEQIKQGRQAFVICPLIDPSDKLGVKSVTEEFEKLDKEVFKDLKIGLMHGKLKPEEKQSVMQDFLVNKIKILVSTSVIEVGIDVPNATIMMVEGADRFGLAQLHQFRGRVGRGEYQSYCFIFTDSEIEVALTRLKYFVDSRDGFALAERDLSLRGPGEVYGTRQSGLPEIKMAKLTDIVMIKQAQQVAVEFLEKYKLTDFKHLKKQLDTLNIVMHFE